MMRLLTACALCASLGVAVAGCSDESSPPARESDGIVGRLTGDPDGQVSPELEEKVAKGVARDENDEPVDDF